VRRAVTLAAFVASAIAAGPAPAGAISEHPLPRCVAVDTELASTLDTRTTRAGDGFLFRTLTDVPPDGDIPPIPKGTIGYGIIALAEHAGASGKPGRLTWEPRFLQLDDGRHLPAMADPNLADGFATGETGNAPDAAGIFPFVGIAVSGYNALHRGHELHVGPGTPLRVVLGDGLVEGTCTDPPASDF